MSLSFLYNINFLGINVKRKKGDLPIVLIV